MGHWPRGPRLWGVSATLVAKDLAGGHAHRTLFEHLDLTVAPGDVVGVVGANGAGKSTLLSLLAGVTAPSTGRVRVRGRIAPLLAVGVGFAMELTGRENVYINAAVLGLPACVIDSTRRYRYVNPEFVAHFGVDERYYLGRTIEQANLPPPDPGDDRRSHMERAMSGELVVFNRRTLMGPNAGQWVRAHYIPLRAEAFVIGVLVVLVDIQQLMDTEQALADRERAAVVAGRLEQAGIGNPRGQRLANHDAVEVAHDAVEGSALAGEVRKQLDKIVTVVRVDDISAENFVERDLMLIKVGADLFRVLELQHVTPGNLRGFVRVKFRNIRNGTLSDQKLRSEDTVDRATVLANQMLALAKRLGAFDAL